MTDEEQELLRLWGELQVALATVAELYIFHTPAEALTDAPFWLLIDRWAIRNDQALLLISQAASETGARPHFRMTFEQIQRLYLLTEIDRHATALYGDTGGWLTQPNNASLFGSRTPLSHMIRWGGDGVEG